VLKKEYQWPGFVVRHAGNVQPATIKSEDEFRGHPLIETRRSYRGSALLQQSGKYRNDEASEYRSGVA
jgi:hypothetical protein